MVSLRARADGILEREVARLRLRLPALDDDAAAEVERAMRRAMSTLLHTPTVRMKQLAATRMASGSPRLCGRCSTSTPIRSR